MAYAAVDLKEYRNALESQFGAQKAGTHTLIHIDQITGPDGVGVAYNLADATMWVLIDDTARMHDPKWKALFFGRDGDRPDQLLPHFGCPGAELQRCEDALGWSPTRSVRRIQICTFGQT